MRVLLTDHFPLLHSASGRHCRSLAGSLAAQGHEVRVLAVTEGPQPAEGYPLRTVVCRRDDPHAHLHFELPWFPNDSARGRSFTDLTDAQLADYREAIRRELDIEVDAFDPQIIHAQHVWLQGQLALETGVPYVLTAWGPGLDCCTADPRYRQLVEQAAENASRILVADEALGERVLGMFDVSPERIVVSRGRPTWNAARGQI